MSAGCHPDSAKSGRCSGGGDCTMGLLAYLRSIDASATATAAATAAAATAAAATAVAREAPICLDASKRAHPPEEFANAGHDSCAADLLFFRMATRTD
jgi:hypothetical protein